MEHCTWNCWGLAVLWILLTTAFVKLAWNLVVCHVTKLKPLKYWQVLLFLGALILLSLPRQVMKHHGHSCCKSKTECEHTLTKK